MKNNNNELFKKQCRQTGSVSWAKGLSDLIHPISYSISPCQVMNAAGLPLKQSLCVSGVYLCEWPEREQADEPGGVTQLGWDQDWTFTAALGKRALEPSS